MAVQLLGLENYRRASTVETWEIECGGAENIANISMLYDQIAQREINHLVDFFAVVYFAPQIYNVLNFTDTCRRQE